LPNKEFVLKGLSKSKFFFISSIHISLDAGWGGENRKRSANKTGIDKEK